LICLQNIVWPEPFISAPETLYHRSRTDRPISLADGKAEVPCGAVVSFNTYFNSFNVERWHRLCSVNKVSILATILGRYRLKAVYVTSDGTTRDIFCESRNCPQSVPQQFDVDISQLAEADGLLYLEVEALSDLEVMELRFCAEPINARRQKLAICITTFARERQVEATARRLEQLLDDLGDAISAHVYVVDNGQSAKIRSSQNLTYLENRNLGGAGGFARGLLEAEDAGCTHCLFMDDDAAFHMENIVRAYAFLLLANDERTALAGAMISNRRRWRLWENGATFNRWPRRQFRGTDLRSFDEVLAMETDRSAEEQPTRYGAWWFFAFPLGAVRHYPFPFFVRGDDVNFGLLNRFHVVTLNGVVSFQDDFQEKTNPQNVYLDVRHSMVQHLTCDQLRNNPVIVWSIPALSIFDSMLRMHYASARAALTAWRDVLAGPDHFIDNLDMQDKRRQIAAVSAGELLSAERLPHDGVVSGRRPNWLVFCLALLTYNGHHMPFFRSVSISTSMPFSQRFKTLRFIGVNRMQLIGSDGSYLVEHDKRAYADILWQSTRLAMRLLFGHRKLTAQYRSRLQDMTGRQSWRKWLELD
jgi:galactofuranosylgalactofuranosylrhamnosyl-N-acetylglucosaminyl-diphospho-decaprenol beta-1,5/1,6-galactofuranosyltransferase